jgi:O-antigen biosynthesis protein
MKYTHININPYEVHMFVFNKIKVSASVLELGCASGYFSKYLKQKNVKVCGVEIEKAAADKAEKWCDKVVVADLENPTKIEIHEKFDYVLLMDVIEHLKNREALLLHIPIWLKPNGKLILTTPNIAYISIRLKLFFGNFTYTKWGILDETHVHFFTKKTLINLLKEQGYKIDEIIASADFGQLPLLGRLFRHIPKFIQFKITQIFPTLLGVQWVVVASVKE